MPRRRHWRRRRRRRRKGRRREWWRGRGRRGHCRRHRRRRECDGADESRRRQLGHVAFDFVLFFFVLFFCRRCFFLLVFCCLGRPVELLRLPLELALRLALPASRALEASNYVDTSDLLFFFFVSSLTVFAWQSQNTVLPCFTWFFL